MNSRSGESGAVPVPRETFETQVKHIKDAHVFDGTKAKFSAWKQNCLWLAKLHGQFEIFC